MGKSIINKRVHHDYCIVWSMRRAIGGKVFGINVAISDEMLILDRRHCAILLRNVRSALRAQVRDEMSMSKTMAELLHPSEGSMVEFWSRHMDQERKAGTGIRGWFRGGKFWSHDNADHYACSEVVYWNSLRTRFQCAARGCDGRMVCGPNELAQGGKP